MSKDQAEERAHGNENIRRVYALPAEMVERITAFQREKGFSSEVEAVRHLLDEALKSRDDIQTLTNKVLAFLGNIRIASEAAKEVLVGHPLVKSVSFEQGAVTFEIKPGEGTHSPVTVATVHEDGWVRVHDESGEWIWSPNDKQNPYAGGWIAESGIPF